MSQSQEAGLLPSADGAGSNPRSPSPPSSPLSSPPSSPSPTPSPSPSPSPSSSLSPSPSPSPPLSPPSSPPTSSPSPQSPTSPPLSPTGSSSSGSSSSCSTPRSSDVDDPLPPRIPHLWKWRCHLCGCRYPLSVTRRCLKDGHYYCSGQGTGKNIKPRHRGRPCSSLFDYAGWEALKAWRDEIRERNERRAGDEHSPEPTTEHDCWNQCTFPSECRYIRKIREIGGRAPDPEIENIILRCALKTPKKRKMLYDMTEGANHLTPVKARKLNPSEEPEEPEEAKSGDEGQSPRENPQASHATGFRLRPPVRLGSLSPS